MRTFFFILALLITALLLPSCLQSPLYPDYCSQAPPYVYGPPTYIKFRLNTYGPGRDAKHTLTFDITECHLETYQAVITYSSQFTWKGFLALGSVGTQIGSYNLDIHVPDGVIDYTVPVYSQSNTTAYVDRFNDGSYDSGVDPTISYSSPGGNHALTVTVPDGGDGRSGTVEGPFTERLIAIINQGIFTNPAATGSYSVTGNFTSVDPDTDNANNFSGYAPQTYYHAENIEIRNVTNPSLFLNLLND
ncbi:MAG: hypothetical protein JRF25_07315 [Deltaproteobacteria bacterium]|nr:hypothetical protein [Deltaproteobacteria bacterium]